MQAKNEFECSHPPCMCPVVEQGGFCSEQCRQARQSGECFCGHEPCLGDEAPALSEETALAGAGPVPVGV